MFDFIRACDGADVVRLGFCQAVGTAVQGLEQFADIDTGGAGQGFCQ